MIPPRVVVDERERSSGVPDLLSKLNVRVYFSRLPIADYAISPEIAVERKALPDFVSSVYDGRLFVQASAISGSYRKPYLIVEGDMKDLAGLTKNIDSYYGAVASVTLAYDLRVIHTANTAQTASAIAALVRNSRSRPVPMAPSRRRRRPRGRLNSSSASSHPFLESAPSSQRGCSFGTGRRGRSWASPRPSSPWCRGLAPRGPRGLSTC